VEAEIAAMGAKVKAYASDAASYSGAEALIQQVVADFGTIDILVNNAGITRDGLVMRMSEQQWDDVMDNNLKSAFNTIHAVTPLMMKKRSGSIINMTSVVGIKGNIGQVNYSASKAGLIGLTTSVAKEFGARGIRCNAIAPGFFVTNQNRALLFNEDGTPTARTGKILAATPMKKFGEISDLIGTLMWLADDNASGFVTGTIIPVDGGFSAYSGV
jgi:3-oxoacyl-[acyl-carrier protein] reductase